MLRRYVHVWFSPGRPAPRRPRLHRPIISRPQSRSKPLSQPTTQSPPQPHSLVLPLLLLAAAAANAPSNLRRQATWDPLTLGASTDRPARVVLPASYYDEQARRGADVKRNYPVLMVLHGWGSSGA